MVDALKDLIRRHDALDAGLDAPYGEIRINSFTVRYNGINCLVIGPSTNVATVASTFGDIGMLLHPCLVNGAVTVWYAAPKPSAPVKSAPLATAPLATVPIAAAPLAAASTCSGTRDLESASLSTVIRHISSFCQMPFECLGLPKFVDDDTVKTRYELLVQRLHPHEHDVVIGERLRQHCAQIAQLLEALQSARNRCFEINARRRIMFAK